MAIRMLELWGIERVAREERRLEAVNPAALEDCSWPPGGVPNAAADVQSDLLPQ